MKKLLIATSLAVALASGPAMAADMPVKAAPMWDPPRPSWTGCYVDGGWGYGLWNQDQHEFNNVTGAADTTGDTTNGGRGWLGRFGGGCDYQLTSMGLGNWVIGAFGDYDVMSLRGNISPVITNAGAAFRTGTEKESGAWYAGGRLGYLVTPTLMTFVSGGWTETHFNSVGLATNAPPGGPADTWSLLSQNYHGWFIGGGDEYALNFAWLPVHGLFWRTEYRFSTYRPEILQVFNGAGVGTAASIRAEKEVQTITSSLVWRFNWWNPVTARY
jgi:outer membrane immunogenic protein